MSENRILFTSESGNEGHPDKIITYLSGIGTVYTQVAGLHRASPSAALDKGYLICPTSIS